MNDGPAQTIPIERRRALLSIARQAIRAALAGNACAGASDGAGAPPAGMPATSGVFVTLTLHGQLRGCIGMLETSRALEEAVTECAVAAATRDDRFAPLTLEELDRCDLEVSVLTSPRTVSGPGEIEIGRHGVIVSSGWRRGVFLPKVPVEHRWDVEKLLSEACRKAGLDRDAWRRDATIEVFEAEAFGERDAAQA